MANEIPTSIELIVATPDRKLAEEMVSAVTLPGAAGELGILPGHAPLLTELGSGRVRYSNAQGEQSIAVERGFAEVLPHRVIILASALGDETAPHK